MLPAYNEEAVIETWLDELRTTIADRFSTCELIIVNDRSTDGTARVLDGYARRHHDVRVEHSEQNQGHGPTLRRAIELSTGDWIFHVDSDKQFVAADFWSLWELRDGADLVLGVRSTRHDPAHRLVLSAATNLVVRVLGGRQIQDANIPFRLIRRALWESVAPRLPRETLAPSISIVLAASLQGRRIVQTPVTHLPREHGASSLRLGRLIRFSLTGLVQLVAFRFRHRRAR